jgi:hypothetical protein
MSHVWKTCSSCKKEIGFNTKYWVCSVSTCNQKRTGWIFCQVECWDAHVPKMNHRECWAEERQSPQASGQTGQAEVPHAKIVTAASEETGDPSPVRKTPLPVNSGTKTIVRRRA